MSAQNTIQTAMPSAPDPVELLQQLIRFNTSNPPGHEKECMLYIQQCLHTAGIETQLFHKDPDRPNLVARLSGKKESAGGAAPLLIYAHVDVVAASPEGWTYPPFEGKIADGYLWGRGALDMKGAVAMMICAFIKAKKENVALPGDVILCLLSDEEELGEYGARFMVEHHADLFKGVRFALGEFGGFSLFVGGKKFYPIEVMQKQKCIIKAVITGDSGHGSAYVKGGTMAKLAHMLHQMDTHLLPVHITTAVHKMFTAIAAASPFPTGVILRQLLNPRRTDFVLQRILKEKGSAFVPMFHNTVNATIIRGGQKINVIPDRIEVEMDVRLLPGFKPEDVIAELRAIIGPHISLEVLLYDPTPPEPNMALFDTLAGILKEADPQGIPVPLLLTGSSDARFFSRLGIQTYGFIPMQLPEEMNFNRTIHAVNERIPVATLSFGTDALYKAISTFSQ